MAFNAASNGNWLDPLLDDRRADGGAVISAVQFYWCTVIGGCRAFIGWRRVMASQEPGMRSLEDFPLVGAGICHLLLRSNYAVANKSPPCLAIGPFSNLDLFDNKVASGPPSPSGYLEWKRFAALSPELKHVLVALKIEHLFRPAVPEDRLFLCHRL